MHDLHDTNDMHENVTYRWQNRFMVSMWAHVIEENIIATVKTWARNGGRGKGGHPKRCISRKIQPETSH